MTQWPKLLLSECCEIVSGSTPRTGVASYWNGDIPWATPTDLSDLQTVFIAETARNLTPAGLRASGARILPAGSVLFSSRAPIGNVAINSVPMATNQGFKSMIPDAERIDPRFLYWWLRINKESLQSLGNGATFKELSAAAVGRVRIPAPPLPEQRRIANVLDRADGIRSSRQRGIALLGRVTESVFDDAFGDPRSNPKRWRSSTVGEVCVVVTDGEHQTPRRSTDGIKLLSARNVRDGYIDFDQVDHIPQDEYIRIVRRCKPTRGDILIFCSGTIGRVALVNTDEPFALVRSAALLRPNTTMVLARFLGGYLRSPHARQMMLAAAHASSQANLFQRQIRELPVFVPPLEMQERFVATAERVDVLADRVALSDDRIGALFASLQHRAFRGDL